MTTEIVGGGSRHDSHCVTFARTELGRILSIYSQRVAAGEWRDYAIDQLQGRAVFSIFRHSLERPLFTITKTSDDTWEVASGARRLSSGDSLDQALTLFSRALRVVS